MSGTNYPQIILKEGREASLLRGHPWIFSGALKRTPKDLVPGELVQLASSSGQPLGVGYYSDRSIAVKMLSFREQQIDHAYWLELFGRAHRYRTALGLTNCSRTNCYRFIHGEGDGVPGLIIDRYETALVVQAQTPGIVKLLPQITAALKELFSEVTTIFDKSGKELNDLDDESSERFLLGSSDSGVVKENGMFLRVNWLKGQKTGFFLDQRENRNLLRQYAKGRSVLNAFSYTGGFSVAALLGDAVRCVSLDSSGWALQQAEENAKRNDVSTNHEIVEADCLKYLEKIEGFDCIVLDPPAFAKHRDSVRSALGGYRRINALGLKALPSGGILFTFSCSQLVSKEQFRDMIFQAALEAGKKVRILKELHGAPCHPINLFHPEGEYLKGLILYVE